MLPDMYYFAEEGSWGSLENGIVADVTLWTAQDFEDVDNCADRDRTFVVRGIVSKYAMVGGIL